MLMRKVGPRCDYFVRCDSKHAANHTENSETIPGPF